MQKELCPLMAGCGNALTTTFVVLAIELHDRLQPGCTAALDSVLEGQDFTEEQQGEYRVIRFRDRLTA